MDWYNWADENDKSYQTNYGLSGIYDGMFGDTRNNIQDYFFFLGAFDEEVGIAYLQENNNGTVIHPEWGPISSADIYNKKTTDEINYLIVTGTLSVPEPSVLALMGLGLISMLGMYRRNMRT